MQVTAILLNYKRPDNMAKIIEAIRAQTVETEIIVWDNGMSFYDDTKVDAVIRSNRNFGCFVRFPMVGLVKTPYVWTQDDDWIITDKELFAKLIAAADRDRFILTRGGKNLRPDGGYMKDGGNVESGQAKAYNTGYCFFPTILLSENLPINPLFCEDSVTEKELPYADDIWVSAYVDGVVMPSIVKGVQPLEERKDGLCFDKDHYPMRDAACKRLLCGR